MAGDPEHHAFSLFVALRYRVVTDHHNILDRVGVQLVARVEPAVERPVPGRAAEGLFAAQDAVPDRQAEHIARLDPAIAFAFDVDRGLLKMGSMTVRLPQDGSPFWVLFSILMLPHLLFTAPGNCNPQVFHRVVLEEEWELTDRIGW